MRRKRAEDSRLQHLYRYAPERRMRALKKYYQDRVSLRLPAADDGQGLALLLKKEESLPYSAFCAGEDMVVLYGLRDGYVRALATLTLRRLRQIERGRGTRTRFGGDGDWVTLSPEALDLVRGLAFGQLGASPKPRIRPSGLAARLAV